MGEEEGEEGVKEMKKRNWIQVRMKWLRNKINQNINKIKKKIKMKMEVNSDQDIVKQLRNKIMIWLDLILTEMINTILKQNNKL